MSVFSPPLIPTEMGGCSINEQCAGIECCFSIDFGFEKWRGSLKTWAIVDPCDYNLSIGVEKWSFNTTLITYKWGT